MYIRPCCPVLLFYSLVLCDVVQEQINDDTIMIMMMKTSAVVHHLHDGHTMLCTRFVGVSDPRPRVTSVSLQLRCFNRNTLQEFMHMHLNMNTETVDDCLNNASSILHNYNVCYTIPYLICRVFILRFI